MKFFPGSKWVHPFVGVVTVSDTIEDENSSMIEVFHGDINNKTITDIPKESLLECCLKCSGHGIINVGVDIECAKCDGTGIRGEDDI